MKYRLLVLLSLCLSAPLCLNAQSQDQFEDDPFAAQQNSMPRARRGTSGWQPAGYANQQDMVNAMLNAKIRRSLKYRFESVGVLGNGLNAPFWTTANRQGLSSVEKSNGYMRYGMFGEMLLPSTFGVKYGMDLGLGAGLQENWFVQQLYIDLDWKCLGLSIGMKERSCELVNCELGSGGLTWSGNSSPIPQIRAGIPQFVRLGFLGNWVALKGHVAYGLFTDNKWRSRNGGSYTDGIMFHSKDVFFKVGDKDRFPLEATIGLEMYAMFGGTMHNRSFSPGDPVFESYDLPHDLKACWKALLPFNKAGEQTKQNGNTLGSWHLSLDWTADEWRVRAYYEHFYEDHSSLLGIEYKADADGNKGFVRYGMKRNWFDGLWGLEINFPQEMPVRNLVLEFMNTKGQCGAVYKPKNVPLAEGVDGRDGMYNHEIYDSYSMNGYTIGNPVLLSPVYNNFGNQRLLSNRVNMFHVGIDGGLGNRIDYQLKCSVTRHWGTYELPFDSVRSILSGMASAYWLAGKDYSWKIGLSYAFDRDDSLWLGNNDGVMVSIVKSWKIL